MGPGETSNERGLKHWFMQFDVGDWLSDEAVSLLKPATRGIWIDAISVMFKLDRCGQLIGSVCDLARLCRCTPNEMQTAISDLKLRNAADVDECNSDVTLTNRRMRRTWTGRKSCRDRKQRYDSRRRRDDVTSDVTPDVTPHIKNHNHNQNSENPATPRPIPLPEIPESLRTSAFEASWAEWREHRRQRNVKLTPLAAVKQLKKCAEWGVERSIAAIEHSIANGYQGLFEPKEFTAAGGGNRAQETDEQIRDRVRRAVTQ
jgi:hypothetical protein